jgi:hypothetical protein
VCFRPGEATFSLFTYNFPASTSFTSSEVKRYKQAPGVVGYSVYKNGVLDDFEIASGLWIQRSDGEVPTFSSKRSEKEQATINDVEAKFVYKYENRTRTETTYSITIRRSTLRFNEDFEWAEPRPDGRQAIPAPQGGQQDQGYCAEFKQ